MTQRFVKSDRAKVSRKNTSESLFAPALRAAGSVLLLMAAVSVSKQ